MPYTLLCKHVVTEVHEMEDGRIFRLERTYRYPTAEAIQHSMFDLATGRHSADLVGYEIGTQRCCTR